MSDVDFALLSGGPPVFSRPVIIGQRYFPAPDRYERAFRGIFERQYYTEYGPLNQCLERDLEAFLGVKHAICVTNESIAMMMAAEALGASGKVIVAAPALAVAASLTWMGLQPFRCDISPDTLQLDACSVAASIDDDTAAIVATNLWGGVCDLPRLEAIAKAHRVPLIVDSSSAFGCEASEPASDENGNVRIFSFHQDNIVSAGEGGCICTNDEVLASRLRTMRGSAGIRTPMEVARTVNGRFSESQAALALIGLEDFTVNRSNNERLHRTYRDGLASVPGIEVLLPRGVTASNFQHAICRLEEPVYGLSCDMIVQLLVAENINARPLPSSVESSSTVAKQLSDACFEVPIGQAVTVDDVKQICSILVRAQRSASAIRASIGSGIGVGAG